MTGLKIKRVGLAANLMKDEAVATLRGLIPELLEKGYKVYVDTDVKPLYTPDSPSVEFGIPDDVDLVMTIGGDGTILKHARRFLEHETPILGIKGGSLGFLTEGRTRDLVDRLDNNMFAIQRRMRIEGSVYSGDKMLRQFNALNEIVVHGAGYSRVVTLHVEVDGKNLRDRSADGMIVATPTGSTAYSLSAGGPLLEPTIEAIVLTPLSPHTLSFRTIVLDPRQQLSIEVSSGRTEIMITVDGQRGSRLEPGEHLHIMRSEKFTNLVVPKDYDFFSLLNEKL